MAKNKTFNTLWAENTTNKETFTTTEIGAGISYQGSVVSNQLNGLGNILSQAIAYQQLSGGYYASDRTYYKGDVCSVLHLSSTHPLTLEFYRLIAEQSSGNAPITGGIKVDDDNVSYYSGGTIDTSRWQRVDSGGSSSGEYTIVKSDIDDTTLYKFCEINTISSLSSNVESLSAEVDFICYFSATKYATFRASFNAMAFNNTISGGVLINGNSYGDSVPNIAISDLSYTGDFSNDSTNMSDWTLFGFKFIVGKITNTDGTENYAIYVKPRTDIQFITAKVNNANGLTCNFNTKTTDTAVASIMSVPVIPDIDTAKTGQIGSLVDYDISVGGLARYKLGLVSATSDTLYNTTDYAMMTRLLGSRGSINHTDRYLKASSLNIGTLQDETLPNITGDFGVDLSTLTNKLWHASYDNFPPVQYKVAGGLSGATWRSSYEGAFGCKQLPSGYTFRLTTAGGITGYSGSPVYRITFSANSSNSTYQDNANVNPKAIIVNRFVRAFK